MEIVIYKIPGCGGCSKINELMQRAEIEYESITVGIGISRENLIEKYPEVREVGFPFTVIDGNIIGGLTDTVRFFVEKGLVSSKTKR